MNPMNSSASASSLPPYRRWRSWLKLTIDRRGSCRSWLATYANRCSSSFDRASSAAYSRRASSARRISVTSWKTVANMPGLVGTTETPKSRSRGGKYAVNDSGTPVSATRR